MWSTDRFDNIEEQVKEKGLGNTWADHLHISPLSELVFFCQYERDLDKFKPTNSGFVTGLYREDKNDNSSWNIIYDLEDILKFMKEHKYRAYMYSGMCTPNVYWYKSGFECFRAYIRDWIGYYKCSFRERKNYRKQRSACLKLAKKLKQYDVLVVDRGDNWYPRLRVVAQRRNLIVDGEDKREEQFCDKFDAKYYNNISLEELNVSVNDEIDEKTYNKMHKRFNDILEYYFNPKNKEEENILYCNCRYRLLDDKK